MAKWDAPLVVLTRVTQQLYLYTFKLDLAIVLGADHESTTVLLITLFLNGPKEAENGSVLLTILIPLPRSPLINLVFTSKV